MSNRQKPSSPVLMSNWQKPSEWFRGETTHKPSTLVLRINQETCAPHLHVHGANRTRAHPISQSHGHQVLDLCDHLWSSAPCLLLLSRPSSLHVIPYMPHAQHETSKHDSPNESKIKKKQNETIPNSNSNIVKLMTHHNQIKEKFLNSFSEWYFTRILPLG
jgi:hypothetical protein